MICPLTISRCYIGELGLTIERIQQVYVLSSDDFREATDEAEKVATLLREYKWGTDVKPMGRNTWESGSTAKIRSSRDRLWFNSKVKEFKPTPATIRRIHSGSGLSTKFQNPIKQAITFVPRFMIDKRVISLPSAQLFIYPF